jgi:hypothetical protein
MVDDINFPKGLPPVSASDRVQKVNRKKREEQKPPFEKFLNQKDQKEKNQNKKKKVSDPDHNPRKAKKRETQNHIESASSTGAVEIEDDAEGKIIDVRV